MHDTLHIAEQLRIVLSRWVRTTRERAGTPTSARLETLRILQDGGPATIATLAQQRSVKHQSMQLVVEQLAREEAVTKRANATDRRSQIVSITGKGRSLVKQSQRLRSQWIATLLEDKTLDEIYRIKAAVDTLESLLESAPGSTR